MGKQQQVIYYRDELQDEFAQDHIQAKQIDGSYKYIRDGFWGRISHVFWYRIIAMPLARLYMKVHFHHRVVNKEVLKKAGNSGYYLYGNHTHAVADAVIPAIVNRPVRVSVIVHPNNVSMPFLGRITPALGALPLPDDREAMKHFLQALEYHIGKKECIHIYPEAHIWPYYTDIRPFRDTSFRYPVQQRVPVFCLTNTYQRRKSGQKPRIVTYIDGPFYPDSDLPVKMQKKALRDQVYAVMKERAGNNNMVLIRYEKVVE